MQLVSTRTITAALIFGCAVSSQSVHGQSTTAYEYDALGRLVAVDYGTSGSIDYVYDAAGNRTSVSIVGGGGGGSTTNGDIGR